MGKFLLEMYWQHAPKTCQNFVELSRRGYYDNTIFHRVISGFMIQGGDPTGTGTSTLNTSSKSPLNNVALTQNVSLPIYFQVVEEQVYTVIDLPMK